MGRSRRIEGGIFEILLDDGRFSYAQALSDPLVGFYEGCFSEPQPVEIVSVRPFKFRVWVHGDAFKRWRGIGNAPIPPEANDQWLFIQDALTKSVELYQHGTSRRRLVDADLGGFEAASIWDPEQVEQRLLDEASGQTNRHAALMLDRARSGHNRRP